VPDRHVGSLVLALEHGHELHLDGVTHAVTNRTLRRDGHDDPVLVLGRTLFDSADNILSDVTGEPLVHGVILTAHTLKLVHGHGTNLDERFGKPVLDPLHSGHQLRPVGVVGAVRRLRTARQELKQRPARASDRRANGRHGLLSMDHGWGSYHLVGGRPVDVEEVALKESGVHRLRATAGDDDVLLVDETKFDLLLDVPTWTPAFAWNVDRSIRVVEPRQEVFGP